MCTSSAIMPTVGWRPKRTQRAPIALSVRLRVREGWLRVIASDTEMQALSARELLDRFKQEKVFWRQFDIGQVLAATNDRGAIAELEAWLTHDDRHLRGNAAFVLGRLGDSRGFQTIAGILADRSARSESCCRTPGDRISETVQLSPKRPDTRSRSSPNCPEQARSSPRMSP